MSIFQHLADPELFGPWFRDPKSWRAWRVVLKALFGDRMTASERKLFPQLTGRTKPPTKRVSESWWIVGRRGGKSNRAKLGLGFLRLSEGEF